MGDDGDGDRGAPGVCLAEQPWRSVLLDGTACLMKTSFSPCGYGLLLCHTSRFWSEEMDADGVRGRLAELNRRLGAPAERVCEHLREAVDSLPAPGSSDLRDGGAANFSWKRDGASSSSSSGKEEETGGGAGAVVALQSRMSGVPLRWEFRLRAARHSVVWRELIAPALGALRVLSREGAALRACIQRKDAEIADYRDGGATVSRKHLETKPFNDSAFRTEFYSKNLVPCADLSAEVVLDGDLQQLYSAVTSQQQQQQRKRKPSPAGEDRGLESNCATAAAAAGATAAAGILGGPAEIPDGAAAPQGVPASQTARTQKEQRRVPHKSTPTKKVKGLFR